MTDGWRGIAHRVSRVLGGRSRRAELDARLEARGRQLDERLQAHGTRLDNQRAQLDMHRTRLDALRDRLAAHAARFDKQRERIEAVEGRLVAVDSTVTRLSVTFDVLGHQIAALESRVEELASDIDLTGALSMDDAQTAEARDILGEIRAEHARVRVRFQVMAAYEERIRRLEAAVTHSLRVDGGVAAARLDSTSS